MDLINRVGPTLCPDFLQSFFRSKLQLLKHCDEAIGHAILMQAITRMGLCVAADYCFEKGVGAAALRLLNKHNVALCTAEIQSGFFPDADWSDIRTHFELAWIHSNENGETNVDVSIQRLGDLATVAIESTRMNISAICQRKPPEITLHLIAAAHGPNLSVYRTMCRHPDQISMRDCRGRLPIHYAAAECRNYPILPYKHYGNCVPPLKILLDAYPEGARTMDKDGNLPLHLALKTYDSSLDRICFNNHTIVSVESAVMDVVRAAPEALGTRDMTLHLYPFQYAAAHSCPLDVIYMVLRQNPGVMKQAFHPHAQEAYLERRLESLEEQNAALEKELQSLEERVKNQDKKPKRSPRP